jgi:Domain of unknown function (DUF5667)
MNLEYERLNERLERGDGERPWNGEKPPERFTLLAHALDRDPEIDELVMLARRLQSSPHLQADPDFADLLESRILLRQASLRRKRPARRWSFPRLWEMHPVYGIALGLCLLILLLGTSVLVAAAQVSNPENPLYAVKRWEQHVQISLSSSSESRAELDVQFARERLNTLAALAEPAQTDAYSQALTDFDQQFSAATSAIRGLSSASVREQLGSELATLEVDARQTLRKFLPQLALTERLLTTDELGRLGETVPRLQRAEIVLSAHPVEHAAISISGDNIQPGAQLLVNGQVIEAQGSFQNGLYVFTASWQGDQPPQSIGILNPDDTVAQTTAITMKSTNGNGNGNDGNSDNGGHGNGNNGGKPDKTPTPHH